MEITHTGKEGEFGFLNLAKPIAKLIQRYLLGTFTQYCKNEDYDQEIPQSHTADQPTAP